MPNPVADFPWKYKHVTASVQVRAGKGVLHTIVINGLTTAGDITVYDNPAATGEVIAVLHLDITTSVSVQPITLTYDIGCEDGLYFSYDDSVAADLTVSYM